MAIRCERQLRRLISSGFDQSWRVPQNAFAVGNTVARCPMQFEILLLQSLQRPTTDAMRTMVRDQPIWMRLRSFEWCDKVPDANAIRDFHEAVVNADALDARFREFG